MAYSLRQQRDDMNHDSAINSLVRDGGEIWVRGLAVDDDNRFPFDGLSPWWLIGNLYVRDICWFYLSIYTKERSTPVWGLISNESMGCTCGTCLNDPHKNPSAPQNITYVRTEHPNQTQMGLMESEC